jgi:diguanylate cyclase (GGDEF)-like protein
MVKTNVSATTHRVSEHILIAISNTARASAIRNLALEFCPTVVLVRDGQDAVDHLDRNGAPRLLVTELSLPRVDGFGVLRHLRRSAPSVRASAIVMSSHESLRGAAIKLAESLGIAQILPLEIDRPSLKRAFADALRGNDSGTAVTAKRPRIEPTPEVVSVDDLVNRALVDLTRQFKVPVAAAYLRLREQRKFAAFGSVADPTPSLDWSKILELLPHAASGADPLLVPDLEHHPLFGHGSAASAIRGFAGVPLAHPGGAGWGAIGVFDAKPLALASDDIDALVAFAGDVALAIEQHVGETRETTQAGSVERDERFEALELLAATDPLTGLANRRGCEKSIASEISRAERAKKPLSCIMVDIDRFKQVNDTLGHQAGDQVLRELSAMLRQSVRAYDIVARWGGEEFLIVLPGANIEAARQLAERIRVGVQTLPTSVPCSVTISAGAAEFDSDYDFESTLRTADRRMFEAKAAGRNCIV